MAVWLDSFKSPVIFHGWTLYILKYTCTRDKSLALRGAISSALQLFALLCSRHCICALFQTQTPRQDDWQQSGRQSRSPGEIVCREDLSCGALPQKQIHGRHRSLSECMIVIFVKS